MKKIFAILAIAALASCGGSTESTVEKTDSVVTTTVDTVAVPAVVDSAAAAVVDSTAAAVDTTRK